MKVNLRVHLSYHIAEPCSTLLQINAARMQDQTILNEHLNIQNAKTLNSVPHDEGIGRRIWIFATDRFECQYNATAVLSHSNTELEHLDATPLHDLPQDVVKYLMPSRYCHPEDFFESTVSLFGNQSGGRLIQSMSNWVRTNFEYNINASDFRTTATDSFHALKGVCRDYAHVLIAMARAVAIPARIVSAYAPSVDPPDFHAVVEVYLGGSWHLIDPTGMAASSETVRICVGRDAADVSFLTSYAYAEVISQTVEVTRN